jgi:hypothetical protein
MRLCGLDWALGGVFLWIGCICMGLFFFCFLGYGWKKTLEGWLAWAGFVNRY